MQPASVWAAQKAEFYSLSYTEHIISARNPQTQPSETAAVLSGPVLRVGRGDTPGLPSAQRHYDRGDTEAVAARAGVGAEGHTRQSRGSLRAWVGTVTAGCSGGGGAAHHSLPRPSPLFTAKIPNNESTDGDS